MAVFEFSSHGRRHLFAAAVIPVIVAGLAGCVVFTEGPVEDDGGRDFGASGAGGSFGASGGFADGAFGSGHSAGVRGADGDKTMTVSSVIKSCLAAVDPFLPCVNERAMAALEQTESMDTVRLDSGLEMAKQAGATDAFAPRGIYSFGDNPYNVGAVIEAASSLLSRRTFCWDLSLLYPGLQMRIGPTYSGRGVIDFFVDRRRNFDERSLGYGHLIFKRSFLPNVLATQISIASVIPLIFAAIYFLTKKAFILSKIALVVTSVVGYGSLFLHHTSKPFGHSFGNHHPFGGHHPIGGHHNSFIGDIRGDKFHGDFSGYQQISISKPSSIFRGVNYFPQEVQSAAYNDLANRNKKEAE